MRARVVRETVTENGAPVGITKHWYAKDKAGKVWCLGEYVTNYKNGKVVGRGGSFEAGVDGAQPRMAMPADPLLPILQLSIRPPSFGSLFLPALGACTSLLIIGAESIHILAALAPSWVRVGWRSDHRCYYPPNRRAERAFALAATSSRSLGGAVVSSEASKRSEIFAMSSTAE